MSASEANSFWDLPNLKSLDTEPSHVEYTTKTKRKDRALCSLNRAHWNAVLKTPSNFSYALNDRGCATRVTYLTDIALFMNALVSNMNFVTHDIGIETKLGFRLNTWKSIADFVGLPEWRIKQCAKFAMDREWITSVQPREIDDEGNFKNLASVKTVTDVYFSDLGLTDAMTDAKRSAINYIVKKAKEWDLPVGFLLTPITMIRKIAFKLSGVKGTIGVRLVGREKWFEWFSQKLPAHTT